MNNKRGNPTFRAWANNRPGGLHGLIATACLTAAALLALSQTLVRHAGSLNCQYLVRADLRSDAGDGVRPFAEDPWRAQVSRQLEEILSRIPAPATASGPVSN
ncbi:hypothetical protein [Paludisphaera sp.]|uniref:hypothetical protein n=1 Tax=Paludisphaera sp. TaxID=2017432 RepID=UPI00301BE7F0